MDAISTEVLFGILIVLILISGFFSSSETSMLSLNPYRLKHLVKKGHKGAVRSSFLLHRPDRLISVILIGNNLVNILATIVAGAITVKLFGDSELINVVLLPLVLTIIILIFAEVTPKSIAAIYPEKVAFPASIVLKPLLVLLYPIVATVNSVSGAIAQAFGLNTSGARLVDHLHPEELRTVVDEAGDLIPDQHQGMLLNVLDLGKATVEDILVPRNEVSGIDLESDIENIMELIRTTEYTRLPVYEGDINKVVGVLHLRRVARFIQSGSQNVTKQAILDHVSEPYFVPESTPLTTQLLNFQKEKKRVALVVDEYGDILGLATLVDLLEEIVGDFATDAAEDEETEIIERKDGWFSIDASMSVREINRDIGWKLPTDGPKTLNGLIVEYLESIPDAVAGFELDGYRVEIQELSDTKIEKALVFEKD